MSSLIYTIERVRTYIITCEVYLRAGAGVKMC